MRQNRVENWKGKKAGHEVKALSPEEMDKYETYEPPAPLDTYKVPPQTMKFKDNPEKDAEKNFKCHSCHRKCSTMQNLKGKSSGDLKLVVKEHFQGKKCM